MQLAIYAFAVFGLAVFLFVCARVLWRVVGSLAYGSFRRKQAARWEGRAKARIVAFDPKRAWIVGSSGFDLSAFTFECSPQTWPLYARDSAGTPRWGGWTEAELAEVARRPREFVV